MSDEEKMLQALANEVRREAIIREREERAAIRERARKQRLMIREHALLRPSKTTLL